MKTKDRLTEVYFQNHSQPNEEEFIDLVQEQMFLAYLSKTLQETRKKYILHSAQQTQAEIATDFQDTGMGSGLEHLRKELIHTECQHDSDRKSGCLSAQ